MEERLDCCDARPWTLFNTVLFSSRSGERDIPLLGKNPLGGDLGDSTVTEGVSCGDEPICIDIGRLWWLFEGDPDRDNGPSGVRGVLLDAPALVTFHGDSGRGRSREIRAVFPTCPTSSLSPIFCALTCSFASCSVEGAMFRPSKCDLKEETGFYSAPRCQHNFFGQEQKEPYDRCAIGVFVIPSIHGLLIAIACASKSRGYNLGEEIRSVVFRRLNKQLENCAPIDIICFQQTLKCAATSQLFR